MRQPLSPSPRPSPPEEGERGRCACAGLQFGESKSMPDTDSGRHTADLRRRIAESTRADESTVLDGLLARLPQDEAQQSRIATRARALVLAMRDKGAGEGVEQFLQVYRLGTREGIVLLCLAEALLRIPDADTADRLIRDKLSAADWQTHLG